jgi:hypothetical protein
MPTDGNKSKYSSLPQSLFLSGAERFVGNKSMQARIAIVIVRFFIGDFVKGLVKLSQAQACRASAGALRGCVAQRRDQRARVALLNSVQNVGVFI